MAKKEEQWEDKAPVHEKKLWQVIFTADGHGQQVLAASEDEARAEMVRIYGEDYGIKSISPID